MLIAQLLTMFLLGPQQLEPVQPRDDCQARGDCTDEDGLPETAAGSFCCGGCVDDPNYVYNCYDCVEKQDQSCDHKIYSGRLMRVDCGTPLDYDHGTEDLHCK
jgi:hypothetical protein